MVVQCPLRHISNRFWRSLHSFNPGFNSKHPDICNSFSCKFGDGPNFVGQATNCKLLLHVFYSFT